MPFSWYYPCYYSPADYSSMYMKPYMITYSNCDRPVVSSNNLVRSDACTTNKPGEDNNKQNSKGMQPRWCPSGLSHTQKRRLQRLRKRGAMRQRIEEKLAKPTQTRKEWRPKQMKTST